MDRRKRLEQSIAQLESQRGILGDEAVETSIAALQKELAALLPADEQRKQVTVLFADLVGFTAMSESMDPEEVREIQQAYIRSVTPPIEQYGGNIEKYIGDAVLAVFGVPRAHEDDPERAVRAALTMQSALEELNGQLEAERGLTLAMRIGLHTGLVVSQVDQEDDFVVTGDTVNLAARLQSAAKPGTVLVSEGTHQLAAYAFETESMGLIQVKGKADPVAVYQVLGVKPEGIKPRGIAGLTSSLVGRELQYDTLHQVVDRLLGGRGGIVTVVGEAGIGKSRLVTEMRNNIPGEEHTWVEGRCLSYGGSIVYHPWLKILRELIGVNVEANSSEVQEQLKQWVESHCPGSKDEVEPFIGKMLSTPMDADSENKLEALDGRQLREATFQAVEIMICCATRQRPLVIVCEDLHWSDFSSLALLEHLLPLAAQVPLLFISVFRQRIEHGSWKLLDTIARDYPTRYADLQLEPLSTGDSRRLVDNLLGLEGLPKGLVDRILGQAEGNPFYLEEVIRSLIDSGVVRQGVDSGDWQVTGDVQDINIPDTLQGVLVARIDRLEREAKRVLQLASVIGRVFLYRILEAIAAEERQLEKKLLSLEQAEMIRQRAHTPELEYIFKHALTQEAAYNGILIKHRRAFHRRIGEALERLFPDRQDEMLGLLAYHWERSGESEKPIEYLHRAGDQARLRYSLEEAINYYQRALVILKDMGDNNRAARTLMKLGLTYHIAFQFRRSRKAYEDGFILWQQHGRVSQVELPCATHALRVPWGSEPETLDPAMGTGVESTSVIDQLFCGLVECTPELDIVTDIARSREISKGGRKYIFHLRADVVWSDGVPLRASDFEYAWKRILDPGRESPHASLLYTIKGGQAYHQGEISDPKSIGVQAFDEVTLVVELERPTGYFLQLLAASFGYPVPRHVVEMYGQAWTEVGNIVFSGPFQLESWVRGEEMVLSVNASFNGKRKGNVRKVRLFYLPHMEWETRLAMYADEELDTVNITWMKPKEMYRVRRQYANDYLMVPDFSTAIIGFNVGRSPFDDRRVRQAFVFATDRERLVDKAMGGVFFPATGGYVPPGMPGHSPGICLPYDPKKAQMLLAKAGYPKGRGFPDIDLRTGSWPHIYPICSFLTQEWGENLGLDLSWKTMEQARFYKSLNDSPPQIYMVNIGPEFPDPDSMLRDLAKMGWQDSEYDRLNQQAAQEINQERRMTLYRQADKILIDEAPIMPIAHTRWHILVKPWVSQFPGSPMRWWFWKDVIIEPH